MRSTFHGLETSKRALLTQQTALHTIGHNIANAATEGYTRQRVTLSATQPMEAVGRQRTTLPGQIGTGVQYDKIERIRDSYLDMQYRRENQDLAMWSIHESVLHSIEMLINEPSNNGLRAVMDKFWNSLEALNRDPMLLSARIDLIGSALNLVDTFRHINSGLNAIVSDVELSIERKLVQANNLIQSIAELNDLIRHTEAMGDNANDFRDQRDLLIDQLSTIVDVQVVETLDGNFTITSAGVVVVDNAQATLLTVANAETATSGELAGYQRALNEVDTVRNQLNAMVNALVTGEVTVRLENGYVTDRIMTANNAVTLEDGTVIPAGGTIPAGVRIVSPVEFTVQGFNGLHRLGYTLSDPAESDIPFFKTADGSTEFTMENIRVNPDIQNDTSKIAASGQYVMDGGTKVTVKGNSDIAHALAGLRDKVFSYPASLTSLASGTIDDYFRAMVGDLGIRANEAIRNKENLQNLVNMVDMRRQSVSGVSLDEELAEMLRFQHAYNAAARNMTTVDEMLDRIINHMGLVGR